MTLFSVDHWIPFWLQILIYLCPIYIYIYGSKTEKKVDIFLIPVLKILQVQKAISYHRKVKSSLRKDSRTGLLLRRVRVKLRGSEEEAVIVFAKGYHEPEDDTVRRKKKDKESKWVAFLSTDTRLHTSTIIKKCTKLWTIEVWFKECKQLLGLGKDQSNDFNAQVFFTTMSFLRYNLLNFLNERENYTTMGDLFQDLADESATITYSQRLWDFLRGLFQVSISKIFDLFEIEEDCSSYINAFTQVLCESTPFQGCETWVCFIKKYFS